MVSKTLLFSFVASLAQGVVSEPGPGPATADVASNGLPDSTSGAGASLVHIRALLSQHITDLSALLDNFTSVNSLNGPVEQGTEQAPLLFPPGNSSTVPLACDCSSASPGPACRNFCGNHEDGQIPNEQASILPDSGGGGQRIPPAGLLPLRFSCDCTPPISISCKVLCANHGGTVWQPPNSVKLASNQPRLRQQNAEVDSASPQWAGCDCNNETQECHNFCATHGGRIEPPDGAQAITAGHGHTGQGHAPPSADPSQPRWDGCDCNNPTPECQIICANHGGARANGTDKAKDKTSVPPTQDGDHVTPPADSSDPESGCECGDLPASVCINICGNHGGSASDPETSTRAASDRSTGNKRSGDQQVLSGAINQQQNASMPWTTESFNNNVAAEQHQYSMRQLTVQSADGSLATVEAEVDLSSYASFASHSGVTKLGFGLEILPWVADGQPKNTPYQSIDVHGHPCKVIGTVALMISDYDLHEVFYVLDPTDTTTDTEDAQKRVLPELIVGVDFLQQIGGLTVKSYLLV